MLENITQITQGNTGVGGNTRTPPPASTIVVPASQPEIDESQIIRSRKFCFTLNNYTTEDYDNIYHWCLGQKVYVLGKEGREEHHTPHIQGYVECRNAMTFRAINKKLGGRCHVEKKKKSDFKAITYCMKEGDFITNSDFRPLKAVKDPMEGMELYEYQKEIKELIKRGGDDRKINWYWETQGNVGKTSFCKHLCLESENTIVLSGKGMDMLNGVVQYNEINHKFPTTVILDIPRCVEHISWGGIEKLKDGCFYSGKYKGKMVLMNSPTVIVFSNAPPDLTKMSADRWNVKKINIGGDDSDSEDVDNDE